MFEGHHFQNAYVCDDLEAGIACFRGRGLVREPQIIPYEQEVETRRGTLRQRGRLAFIWIDDLQYELIEMELDEVGLYANCQSNGGPLRFHHICMRVPDWAAFRARVDQQDLPLVMERDMGEGQLKFCYLDARRLVGHYLEYLWTPEDQWQMMRAM